MIFKWLKNKDIENLENNKYTREFHKYKIIITMLDGEIVEFITDWIRINQYIDKIESYKSLLITNIFTINIKNVIYSTKYIVKIEHELLDVKHVKSTLLSEYSNSGAINARLYAIKFYDDEVE